MARTEVAAAVPSTRGVELYTRMSLYWMVAFLALGLGFAATPTGDATATLITAGLAGALTLISIDLTRRRLDRLALPPTPEPRLHLIASGVAVLLAATICWWTAYRLDPGLLPVVAGCSFGVVAATWTPVLNLRRTVLTGALAALGGIGCWWLFGAAPRNPVAWLGIALLVAVLVGTFGASVWILRVTIELDRARGTAARLAVAEERLRFSRDLHDVVGRTLAAVSLKTQLAAGLVGRGRSAEALAELDQVRSTIDDAAREVRAVAHGYRRSDLAVELRGAASLLGSAGVDCKLAGSKLLAQAPAELGWVVREAVTNVLRHSTATLVRITLERRVKGASPGWRSPCAMTVSARNARSPSPATRAAA